MEDQHQLHGTIEKVVYKNDESGFAVCSLKVNAREQVTISGTIPGVHQGERVTLTGSWVVHPKFGKQFEVTQCIIQLPTTAFGIQKYLSSGLIKGIGPKLAERLVNAFGDKTLEVIDQEPEKLSRVSGVGEKKIGAILAAWQEQKSISQVMVFLKSKDVSTAFASKIFKIYGQQSINKIQENPYRLIDDIWGVGFKMADQLALKLGFAADSLYRIAAGVIHAITESLNQGHLYTTVSSAKEVAHELLVLNNDEAGKALVSEALRNLYNQAKIKLVSFNDEHYLTLPMHYFAEKGIASKIKNLVQKKDSQRVLSVEGAYEYLQKNDQGVLLNEQQQRGVLACIESKITIITGGPGTGKTTLIKKLIEILEKDKVQFRLAAPTGRAAKRMFESTKRSCETLHRLLEYMPGAGAGFGRNEQNALELDFLVIDEASMIDVFLMNSVLKALPDHAHLVLLGDVDQLPSVGAGNVLNDLICSGVVEVVRLTQIFRQAADSLIVVNAHRINNGEFPVSFMPDALRDFVFIKEEAPEKTFALLKDIYETKLPKMGIDVGDSIVLVPMNRGIVGSARINEELQKVLNPTENKDKQVSRFGVVYKVKDRVMQIKNNYDKFVFNGDMGVIIDINIEDQELLIQFGERELEYEFSELDELTLSYAISIHKSQGSEFSAVIIPIFMSHFVMLQRNLIYTAITRAKRLCILIGQPKAIAMAIGNNKGTKRTTFLTQYLTTDLAAR